MKKDSFIKAAQAAADAFQKSVNSSAKASAKASAKKAANSKRKAKAQRAKLQKEWRTTTKDSLKSFNTLKGEWSTTAKDSVQALSNRYTKRQMITFGIIVAFICILGFGGCSTGSNKAADEQPQNDTQQISVSVDTQQPDSDSAWDDASSPVGVKVESTDGQDQNSTDVQPGQSSRVDAKPTTNKVEFDNDYYLKSDGTLMRASAPTEKDTSQDKDVNLTLEKVDYDNIGHDNGVAAIDTAANYVESRGDSDKAQTLKNAALTKLSQTESAHQASASVGTLKIHYLDVGQGDSEFIELPNGKTMLIDAGPTDHSSSTVNYIQSQGHRVIDYVVATHPHEDHIGGMPAIMKNFNVDQVWATDVSSNTSTYEKFLDSLGSKEIYTAFAGRTIFDDGGCSAKILSPNAGATSFKDLNDSSVVILLSYNGHNFLFTGDAESNMISGKVGEHVDILKVPHHGSTDGVTSSLLSEITPSYAVISCGAHNSYGHPTSQTLNALQNTPTFRTDLAGTIVATYDANGISFNKTVPAPGDAGSPGEKKSSHSSASSSSSSSSSSSGSSSQTTPPPVVGNGSTDGSATVYVTTSGKGKKYHSSPDCRSLRRSSSVAAISLSEAESEGYKPCGICKPPQ